MGGGLMTFGPGFGGRAGGRGLGPIIQKKTEISFNFKLKKT